MPSTVGVSVAQQAICVANTKFVNSSYVLFQDLLTPSVREPSLASTWLTTYPTSQMQWQ